MTNKIFGRWELAIADDVYNRNGYGRNIGAQTYNIYLSVDQTIINTC